MEAQQCRTITCVLLGALRDVMGGMGATWQARNCGPGELDVQPHHHPGRIRHVRRSYIYSWRLVDHVAKTVQIEELQKALGRVAEEMGKLGTQ